MLSFFSPEQSRDRLTSRSLSRREWLRIGTLASLGLGSPTVSAERSATPSIPGFGRAKSVIVVFASGGQSQIDTWDPKPEAPQEIRGAFETIRTAVPGTHFCEHMPQIARVADRLTVLRTVSHEDLDHGSAVYLTLTGQYHTRRSSNPPPRPTDYPTHGAVLKRVRPRSEFVEPAVHVNAPAIISPNNISPGQFGGFLGADYDPLTVGNVLEGEIVIPGLAPRGELPGSRLKSRQSLLHALDEAGTDLKRHQATAQLSSLYEQAFAMLDDPTTRQAFNLSREPESLRQRYGMNRSGQACLLARRLVQAGVPLISVIWNHHSRGQDHDPNSTDAYGWDTHNDIFAALQNRLLPRFDQSFSALIEDLDNHGLLEDTLVVCLGEFGRAPRVAFEANFKGKSPGRKHWAATYSIALAGAGVGRGQVIGRSDRIGGFPASEKYGPWDVAATIFSALGIDPAGHYQDLSGRPYPITSGRPISAVYAG